LPRPAGLTAALAAALTLVGPIPVPAQPYCAQSLSVDADEDRPGTLRLRLDLPCRPYGSLILGYGPLAVAEQTSAAGTLALDLPRLTGAESVSATLGDLILSAPVPPASGPTSGFAAVTWGDAGPWASLASPLPDTPVRRLGFRAADGAPDTDLIVSDGPVVLRVPVTAETCGTTQSARIATDAAPRAQDLTLTLPGCAASGQVIEIPLR
jgi:hypothetical protein